MAGVNKIYPPQKQVLKNIYLSFFYGAKIGVIGLNGSGKSSLLKIIAGLDKSYQGEVVFSPGYSVGYLAQEPILDNEKTVREIVEEGVAKRSDSDELTILIGLCHSRRSALRTHQALSLDDADVSLDIFIVGHIIPPYKVIISG